MPFTEGLRRPGDPPALFADNSKVKSELDWEPEFNSIKDIIETAWAWHKNHPDGFK